MRNLTQMNELLDAHHEELTELFKQQCLDEDLHRKDYNFLTIVLVIIISILCIFNFVSYQRLSHAEQNIEAMGQDLIEAKRQIRSMSEDINREIEDVDQLVCELRESGHIDSGWTCQLYDEYE